MSTGGFALDARIKLRHLVAFCEVVRQGSVSSAAEVLGISQPAVTKTVSELEAIVGVPLFTRGNRRLTLSPAGRLFESHAFGSITALEAGLRAIGVEPHSAARP